MDEVINAKALRRDLAKILERARRGERFTVLYRSRPVCRILPPDGAESEPTPVEEDSLHRASAVGSSVDGRTAADHDEILYDSPGR